MTSIKPSGVPEYLKDSAFFVSFSEDDEEVSVPQDCCKLDTSVTNTADLEELLRTLRFWGVDRIPVTIIHFIVCNERAVWDPVTSIYVADLPMVAELVRVMDCKCERQVYEAASLRNLDVVTCLLEHCCPGEYIYFKTYRSVDISARNGDLDILKILRQHNYEFHVDTSRAAVLNGHYECLKYMMQNGCPEPQDLLNRAVRSGKVEIIQYLHDRGLPWPDDILRPLYNDKDKDSAKYMQNVQACLPFAYKLGCPRDPLNTCIVASTHGWYDILVDGHRHGCKLFPYCTYIAAANGHLDCLVYLHENGCPWSADIASKALTNKQFDCFIYAAEHGCPVQPCIYRSAVMSGSVEAIKYLWDRGIPWPENIVAYHVQNMDENADLCLHLAYQLGCPRDPSTCYIASQYGWYDILVDAHQHGCRWDGKCISKAACNGHLNCLIYLHEHGCPWDETLISGVLLNLSSRGHNLLSEEFFPGVDIEYYDCLKYALEHGCPLPSEWKCRWSFEELQRFLFAREVSLPVQP